jgi:hypothetical protein
MAAPAALLVMKNPIVARKTSQTLSCAGFDTSTVEDASQLADLMTRGPSLVCVPDTAVDEALALVRNAKDVRLFAYTEELRPVLFAKAADHPVLNGIFGVRYPGAGPRPWELLAVARRVATPRVPPPNAPLAYGHDWFEITLRGSGDRSVAVGCLEEFAGRFVTGRMRDGLVQTADEMIMNALYDAPIDSTGRPKFAHQRKQSIELPPEERPTFAYGCDGMRLALSISDPFGTLPRKAVFGGLHRGLATGTIDTSGGGAGLGMMMICQTAKILYFDVVPRRLTQVTAVIELDVPLRQLRTLPASVHTFIHRA